MSARGWLVTMAFSAFLYAAIDIYLFPMLGDRVNIFSAGCTFMGASLTAWGFGRILTHDAEKMAWAVFAGGIMLLILMWYMVF